MKWHMIVPLVFLCSSTTVLAASFDEAMRQARQSEAALEPGQMVSLVEAQGSAMQRALTQCTPRRGTIPDSFATVFRIDESGAVAAAWTRSESDFEKCFAASMRRIFHYVPPMMPFHTAIEYRKSESRE